MGCGSSAKPYQGESKTDPKTESKDAAAAQSGEGTAAAAKAAPAPAAATKADDASKAAAPEAAAAAAAPAAAPAAAKEEEDPDEDEDDEMEMDEAEFEKQVMGRIASEAANGPRKTRCAVSSESTARSADWKAPVYEKTKEQEERLTKALGQSFMFAALSGEDLPVVIKAFKETPVTAGTTVITQGDEVVSDQPALYVFESGALSVYKTGTDAAVFKYDSVGQYFGDLALLYNAPRAATVKADTDCVLWSIDRNTFNYLVKDAARMAVEKRMSFLEEVPILKGLTPEEKATLSDVMNVKIVMKDDFIIKQGDIGREFFILESGKLVAKKDDVQVMEYSPKDYFGELALMADAPRAASVVATEMSKVLSLDSGAFGRIVGKLEVVMKERAAQYEGVVLPK